MLDGALLEVIEHLIAGDFAGAGDLFGFLQIRNIEIAHAPGENFPVLLELFESTDGLLERILPTPMQEITIERVGPQAFEGPLAG